MYSEISVVESIQPTLPAGDHIARSRLNAKRDNIIKIRRVARCYRVAAANNNCPVESLPTKLTNSDTTCLSIVTFMTMLFTV